MPTSGCRPPDFIKRRNYPRDGKVAITLNPKQSASYFFWLRVPNHQTSHFYTNTPEVSALTSPAINGQPVKPVIEKRLYSRHPRVEGWQQSGPTTQA